MDTLFTTGSDMRNRDEWDESDSDDSEHGEAEVDITPAVDMAVDAPEADQPHQDDTTSTVRGSSSEDGSDQGKQPEKTVQPPPVAATSTEATSTTAESASMEAEPSEKKKATRPSESRRYVLLYH